MNPNARTWSHLRGFERDVIVAVLRRGGRPRADDADRPYGLGIKRELEIMRDTDINHGRLYPNLDGLVDDGLLTKGKRDRRTNTYAVTEAGCAALAEYLSEYVGSEVDATTIGVLPARAFDEQTSRERGDDDAVADGGDA